MKLVIAPYEIHERPALGLVDDTGHHFVRLSVYVPFLTSEDEIGLYFDPDNLRAHVEGLLVDTGRRVYGLEVWRYRPSTARRLRKNASPVTREFLLRAEQAAKRRGTK